MELIFIELYVEVGECVALQQLSIRYSAMLKSVECIIQALNKDISGSALICFAPALAEVCEHFVARFP